MQQNGLEATVWSQNTLTWLLMCILLLLRPQSLRHLQKRALALVTMACCVAVIGSAFFGPGLNGVHRWISAGPLLLQPAAILLPLFLICAGSVPRALVCIFALVSVTVLALQPDPASATALVAALSVRGAFAKERPTHVEWTALGLLVVLVMFSWSRQDPLPQVQHVEGIIALARSIHPALAWAGLLSLLLLPLPFVICSVLAGGKAASASLAAYFIVMELVCITGRFPVPVLGYGASPVIGYVLAVAWMATSLRFPLCVGVGADK